MCSKVLLFSMKPRRTRVRILRLSTRLSSMRRRWDEKGGDEMELKNLRLYMENINIHKENEKLRKKACLLEQERLALLSEFQRRFSRY
ncbi:hypothetical protein AAHA92_15875 [Salvia divinorum]|uniref:Uncharacterized protein n=1 Tax=Salvia divinorum TaxID=28513 RepID=A0ABD1GTS2_SALDI